MSFLLKDLVPDIEVFLRHPGKGAIVAFRTPDGKQVGVRECTGSREAILKLVGETVDIHEKYRQEELDKALKSGAWKARGIGGSSMAPPAQEKPAPKRRKAPKKAKKRRKKR